jgi:hypothetical protein
MLNYIWAGLIVFSFVFAMIRDVGDITRDTFRNGKALPVTIKLDGAPPPADAPKREQAAHVVIDPSMYKSFYNVPAAPTAPYAATLATTKRGSELRFAADASFPAPLMVLKDTNTSEDDKELRAEIIDTQSVDATTLAAHIRFSPVRFATMQAIAKAAMSSAKKAVELALGLIGVIALWLGLTRVGRRRAHRDLQPSRAPDPQTALPRSPARSPRDGVHGAEPHRPTSWAWATRDTDGPQGDGGAADAQPEEGHGNELDGDALGDAREQHSAPAAGAGHRGHGVACDERVAAADLDRQRAGADDGHHRRKGLRAAARGIASPIPIDSPLQRRVPEVNS